MKCPGLNISTSVTLLGMKKRDASAVMLVRGTGDALEVFLAERSPELRFFGGYWALPGGVRGPEDGPDDEALGDTPALLRCGIRELFEAQRAALA